MTETVDQTPRTNDRMILTAMIVVVAMTFIDMTIVSIAAPDIQRGLHLTSTGLQWVVSGYLASLAAFFALGGRLADVVGHRTMVVLGSLVFIGASVMCGLTPDGSSAEAWIVIFRIVQGIGAALLFPAALAVVVSEFPIERRGRAVAVFFAIAGGLTAVGPFAGSFLLEWSWRAIFFVNVPVAIIGLALTFAARIPNRKNPAPIDYVGAVLIVAGIGTLVLGLQQASTWGWSSLPTLGCIVGGIVLMGIFVEVERARPNPLIRIAFFENRTFSVQNVILLIASAAFVPVFYFASIYAQVGLGWESSNAGLYLLIFFGGFAPGVQLGGRWLDKGEARKAAVWGGVIGAAGFFCWAARLQGLSENSQWPWILLAGAGLGLVIGSSNTDAINQVSADHFGEATGITQTARNLGAALGMAILGTVLTTSARGDIESTLSGFGISKQKADAIAASLHGSGGGKTSSAFAAQAGSKAQEVFHAVRLDFADASKLVFQGMGIVMVVVAIVAFFGLTRGAHVPDSGRTRTSRG
jgi:EmrB/QacA subfamily drug resistance transporter